MEKTADEFEAGSNSDFYYVAYTNGGQTCDMGKLDLDDYNDRMRGKSVAVEEDKIGSVDTD